MDDIVLGFEEFDYCVRVLEDLKSLLTQFKDMVHSKTTTIFRDAIVSHLSVLNYTVGEALESVVVQYGWDKEKQMFRGPLDEHQLGLMISSIDMLIDKLVAY